jgi:hypothetical protein
MTVKDGDGEIFEYSYHQFTETPDGQLLIYKAGGLSNDGTREMIMVAHFRKHGAILNIEEVEDESEG